MYFFLKTYCLGSNQWNIPPWCPGGSCLHHHCWKLDWKLPRIYAYTCFHSLHFPWCPWHLLPSLWLFATGVFLCPSHTSRNEGSSCCKLNLERCIRVGINCCLGWKLGEDRGAVFSTLVEKNQSTLLLEVYKYIIGGPRLPIIWPQLGCTTNYVSSWF